MLMWLDYWQCVLCIKLHEENCLWRGCMKMVKWQVRWQKWVKWKGHSADGRDAHWRPPAKAMLWSAREISANSSGSRCCTIIRVCTCRSVHERGMRWSVYNPCLFTAVGRARPSPANNNFFMQGRCCCRCNEKIHQTRKAHRQSAFLPRVFRFQANSPFLLLWTFSSEIPCPTMEWCSGVLGLILRSN